MDSEHATAAREPRGTLSSVAETNGEPEQSIMMLDTLCLATATATASGRQSKITAGDGGAISPPRNSGIQEVPGKGGREEGEGEESAGPEAQGGPPKASKARKECGRATITVGKPQGQERESPDRR